MSKTKQTTPDLIDKSYQTIWRTWQSKQIESAEQLADILENQRIGFAYNSGRIENSAITYHDTRSIFESGSVSGFSGDPRTLFEIQNQRECLLLVLDAFGKKFPLDETLLLNVHRTLTQGTYDERRWKRGERPGAYKINDYVIGVDEIGLPASEVPKAMQELLDEIGIASENNILTVAAYFHLSLESIHPFADGNGRVGRALQNYLLILNNHPPITIYDEDKLSYYGAISAWDRDGDLAPMLSFLKAETVKTWSGKI